MKKQLHGYLFFNELYFNTLKNPQLESVSFLPKLQVVITVLF